MSSLAYSLESDPCISSGDLNVYVLYVKIIKDNSKRVDSSYQSSGCEFEMQNGNEYRYNDYIDKSVDGGTVTSIVEHEYFVGYKYSGTGTIRDDRVNLDFKIEFISNIGDISNDEPPALEKHQAEQSMSLEYGKERLLVLGSYKVSLRVEPGVN